MRDSYHFCKHKIVTKTCLTQNMLRFPILWRPWRPSAANSITDASTFFRSPTCVSFSKNHGFCVFDRSAKGILLLFVRFIFCRLSSEGPLCCPFGTAISNVSALVRFCYFCFRDSCFTFFLLRFRCAFSNISPVYKENLGSWTLENGLRLEMFAVYKENHTLGPKCC